MKDASATMGSVRQTITRSVRRGMALLAHGRPGAHDAHTGLAAMRREVRLRDGTCVCLRAVRPDDKERLRIAVERLSPRSRYRRFLGPKTGLTPGDLRQLTDLDFVDHVGLGLTIDEAGTERLVAVGRFVRIAPGSDRAELAFTVADDYQRRGAATLLLRELVTFARRRGVRAFVAEMLEENVEMLHLLRSAGFPLRQTLDHGMRRAVLGIEVDLPSATSFPLVATARHLGSVVARSLVKRPASVVGANGGTA